MCPTLTARAQQSRAHLGHTNRTSYVTERSDDAQAYPSLTSGAQQSRLRGGRPTHSGCRTAVPRPPVSIRRVTRRPWPGPAGTAHPASRLAGSAGARLDQQAQVPQAGEVMIRHNHETGADDEQGHRPGPPSHLYPYHQRDLRGPRLVHVSPAAVPDRLRMPATGVRAWVLAFWHRVRAAEAFVRRRQPARLHRGCHRRRRLRWPRKTAVPAT